MAHTDPVADMLTRIRNANAASKTQCDIPASNLKENIAKVLLDEGYIADFQRINAGPQGIIRVTLKYGLDREHVIHGLKRISKPGLRQYVKCKDIPEVMGGLGTAIVSTPSGVMTGRRARRERVGGELLALVW